MLKNLRAIFRTDYQIEFEIDWASFSIRGLNRLATCGQNSVNIYYDVVALVGKRIRELC